jgi:hypothetical protein
MKQWGPLLRAPGWSLRPQALAATSLETIHFGPEYCGESPFELGERQMGRSEMKAEATKLEHSENDLKQLMADVTRAMEKDQEAVARIASKAAPVTTEVESISR